MLSNLASPACKPKRLPPMPRRLSPTSKGSSLATSNVSPSVRRVKFSNSVATTSAVAELINRARQFPFSTLPRAGGYGHAPAHRHVILLNKGWIARWSVPPLC